MHTPTPRTLAEASGQWQSVEPSADNFVNNDDDDDFELDLTLADEADREHLSILRRQAREEQEEIRRELRALKERDQLQERRLRQMEMQHRETLSRTRRSSGGSHSSISSLGSGDEGGVSGNRGDRSAGGGDAAGSFHSSGSENIDRVDRAGCLDFDRSIDAHKPNSTKQDTHIWSPDGSQGNALFPCTFPVNGSFANDNADGERYSVPEGKAAFPRTTHLRAAHLQYPSPASPEVAGGEAQAPWTFEEQFKQVRFEDVVRCVFCVVCLLLIA